MTGAIRCTSARCKPCTLFSRASFHLSKLASTSDRLLQDSNISRSHGVRVEAVAHLILPAASLWWTNFVLNNVLSLDYPLLNLGVLVSVASLYATRGGIHGGTVSR